MAWMKDTFQQLNSVNVDSTACVTGKPISQGGIRGRTEATGLGVCYGLREFLSYDEVLAKTGLSPGIPGKSIIVQGFGNVGYWASHFFAEHGGKVTGIIEWNGGIINPAGLDIDALFRHWSEKKTFQGFGGGTFVPADKALALLEAPCDILVPAALEQQVHRGNADRIQAKVIVEAANGPTTPAAEQILLNKGNRVILPDLLLNGGGVTVSYFEWLKNLAHVRFGRLNKKWEEKSKLTLLNLIQRNSAHPISDVEKAFVIQGASERDIVYSGLDDTMSNACQETRVAAQQYVRPTQPTRSLPPLIRLLTHRLSALTTHRTPTSAPAPSWWPSTRSPRPRRPPARCLPKRSGSTLEAAPLPNHQPPNHHATVSIPPLPSPTHPQPSPSLHPNPSECLGNTRYCTRYQEIYLLLPCLVALLLCQFGCGVAVVARSEAARHRRRSCDCRLPLAAAAPQALACHAPSHSWPRRRCSSKPRAKRSSTRSPPSRPQSARATSPTPSSSSCAARSCSPAATATASAYSLPTQCSLLPPMARHPHAWQPPYLPL